MRVHRNAKTTLKRRELIVTRAQQGWTCARIASARGISLPLYRLLESAGPIAARLMVLFATVSVPMALLNLGHSLNVLAAVRSAVGGPAVATPQSQNSRYIPYTRKNRRIAGLGPHGIFQW
jgi:alpha-L-arabinofuranosidase